MAERRMFAKTIIDSDLFIDMPLTAQALYFHLSMRADDDGFINNPKKIQRMINSSDDDFRLLIAKQFIIPFQSGICVIKHWRIHNYIQRDRYKPTFYQEEKQSLSEKSNIYNQLDTECIQDVSKPDTQVRLGKDRLDKVSIGKENPLSFDNDERTQFDYQSILNAFHSNCISLPKVTRLTDKRKKAVKAAAKKLDTTTFEQLFAKVEESDFLTGRNGEWYGCGFDWIMKSANLIKVIEGNYDNKTTAKSENYYDQARYENISMEM